MTIAHIGGVEINYLISGRQEAPWLTFSNSLATDLRLWDAQVAVLERRFRILRYDTRGHGASASPNGPYTLDLLVGDLLRLWDHLGISQSHLVGLSLGGMTALGMAIEHPNRLLSAVVSDARADAPAPFANAWDDRLAVLDEGGIDALVESTIERWFTAGFQQREAATLDRIRAMIRATSATGYAGCARALQRLDYLPRLPEIDLPTRFIVGTQDGGAPPDVMRVMHESVPGSSFIEIDPAGHLANIENPNAFNAALESFLPD